MPGVGLLFHVGSYQPVFKIEGVGKVELTYPYPFTRWWLSIEIDVGVPLATINLDRDPVNVSVTVKNSGGLISVREHSRKSRKLVYLLESTDAKLSDNIEVFVLLLPQKPVQYPKTQQLVQPVQPAPTPSRIDKTGWPDGPWMHEPDDVDFTHAGLLCALRRSSVGSWSGYVRLPEKPLKEALLGLVVHGGVTFNTMDGDTTSKSSLGEAGTGDRHWIGFDCTHPGDRIPSFRMASESDHYWTLQEVRYETACLAVRVVERHEAIAHRRSMVPPRPVLMTDPVVDPGSLPEDPTERRFALIARDLDPELLKRLKP